MLEQNLYELNEKYNIFMNIDSQDKERFKNIIGWAGQMMELTIKEKLSKQINPKRGEIWTCNFGENVGSEVNKIRPVVVLQNNIGNAKSPTTIVIPITTREERQPTHVGLEDDDFVYVENCIKGTVLTEQIRIISKARLGRKIAELSENTVKRIEEATKIALGFAELKE